GRPNLDPGSELSRNSTPPRPSLFHAVRLSRRAHQRQTADALEDLAAVETEKGKRRRDWRRKATQLRHCGTQFHGERCNCGFVKGYIEVGCGLRVCTCCARRNSRRLAARLLERTSQLRFSHGLALYFITFTTVFDPMSEVDLSVAGIRLRCERLLAAVQYSWKRYLKSLSTETAAAGLFRKVEVAPRGAVHCHALFFGRRPDIDRLRMLYLEKAPGSTILNIQYVRTGKDRQGSIHELAKYLTKGASPAKLDNLRGATGEYLDPILAARVEFALSGKRLFEAQGCFRGIPEDEPGDDVAGDSSYCPVCGEAGGWTTIDCALDDFLPVAPPDWTPVFARKVPTGQRQEDTIEH
ncbi:MAG: hypothetical protein WBN22_12565, partial [Verrucomicrobiia bacterium]